MRALAFSLFFTVRVELVRVIDEVALTHFLRHQLLETLEIFTAKHAPEFDLVFSDELAVEKVAARQLERLLLVFIFVEFLHQFNSLLQLHRHLVDLSRLHVHVIDSLRSNVRGLARDS